MLQPHTSLYWFREEGMCFILGITLRAAAVASMPKLLLIKVLHVALRVLNCEI